MQLLHAWLLYANQKSGNVGFPAHQAPGLFWGPQVERPDEGTPAALLPPPTMHMHTGTLKHTGPAHALLAAAGC